MHAWRTYLKIIAGAAAFLLPWTAVPQVWEQRITGLEAKPAVQLVLPQDYGAIGQKPSNQILSRKAIEDIRVLSSAEMQGRKAGTAGETKALVYLEGQVTALNLKAYGNNRYWQMFSIPPMEEKIINGRALLRPVENDPLRMPAANILAGIPGEDQEETLIISAHFDHLGEYQGKLSPGANDNASGVGCVLEVMRRLVQDDYEGIHPRCNITAIFWSAEEMGLLGSKYFVKNPLIPLSRIKAVINFDTVGNGDTQKFILWSNGDCPWLADLKEAFLSNGAEITPAVRQGHLSDDASFTGTGVPAVTVLSRDWLSKNHTPEDDISLINEEKLEVAVNSLYDLVKKLAY